MARPFKNLKAISTQKRPEGEEPLTFRDNLKALQHLPPFLKMIWQTDPRMATTNIILRLIQAGIPVTTLYIGKLIIEEVLRLMDQPTDSKEYLWMLVAAEFGLAMFSALLNRGISLSEALIGDKFTISSSVKLMDHAAKLDLPQFEDAKFYDKLERARRSTTNRVYLLSEVLRQGQDIVTMLFLAAGLIVFNPWLILLLVVAVIPAFISETHFNQRSYSLAKGWTPERRELDYLRYIGASDRTAKEVKIFGLEGFIRDRFSKLSFEYFKKNRKLAVQRASWGFVFNSLGDIGYYGAYVVIVLQTIAGVLTIGDLTFLSGSFSRLRGLLRGILSRFSSIAQSALYLQDFFEYLALEPEIQSPEQPIRFPNPIQSGFTFEKVSFKYPNAEKWALRNLSFHLQAGEKLALVGENGAGKTTLVKLLARLYDPTEGRILLDGQDLKNFSIVELRKAVGVIFQDFEKFQMTAAENIAVGEIAAREDRSRIEVAAHKSLAEPVITGLPNQYDQLLGKRFEGGMDLSGGQWQKVALARAYMRNAQLMILDEPTSALDARAEYEIFEQFTELSANRTAVLISHRFSTVRMADRILVLEQGKFKEMGSHKELLAAQGLYAELFELQAEGYR